MPSGWHVVPAGRTRFSGDHEEPAQNDENLWLACAWQTLVRRISRLFDQLLPSPVARLSQGTVRSTLARTIARLRAGKWPLIATFDQKDATVDLGVISGTGRARRYQGCVGPSLCGAAEATERAQCRAGHQDGIDRQS